MGAGVAGPSLSYALGNEGRNVLLLERDPAEPVRIVGELLQPGGYLKLKELGLEHCVDGIDAQKVYGYAMYKDGGEALVLCAVGAWVSAPLRVEARQNIYRSEGLLLAAEHFKALGGTIATLSWEQLETVSASHVDAQGGFLTAERSGVIELLEVTGVLEIVSGVQTASYPAVITRVRPGIPYGPESEPTRSFEVIAGMPEITSDED